MSVGVMKDYKLKQRNLRASHTLVLEEEKKNSGGVQWDKPTRMKQALRVRNVSSAWHTCAESLALALLFVLASSTRTDCPLGHSIRVSHPSTDRNRGYFFFGLL